MSLVIYIHWILTFFLFLPLDFFSLLFFHFSWIFLTSLHIPLPFLLIHSASSISVLVSSFTLSSLATFFIYFILCFSLHFFLFSFSFFSSSLTLLYLSQFPLPPSFSPSFSSIYLLLTLIPLISIILSIFTFHSPTVAFLTRLPSLLTFYPISSSLSPPPSLPVSLLFYLSLYSLPIPLSPFFTTSPYPTPSLLSFPPSLFFFVFLLSSLSLSYTFLAIPPPPPLLLSHTLSFSSSSFLPTCLPTSLPSFLPTCLPPSLSTTPITGWNDLLKCCVRQGKKVIVKSVPLSTCVAIAARCVSA